MYTYNTKEVSDLIESFFGNVSCTGCQDIVSTVIKNDETGAIVEVELPGYKKEDVSITVDENVLLVNVDGKRGKKTVKRVLGKCADISSISASFEDGILTITVPCVKKNVVNVVVK